MKWTFRSSLYFCRTLSPVIRLVIFEASLGSWELQCNYNWSWRCPIIFIMMGNVLKGFDVRFSQADKARMTVNVLSDHYLTIHPVVLTQLTNSGRNLESWFTSSNPLLPPNSFWEKTKSKFWEKIMKTEQCRCQPRTEAGISVIKLRLYKGEREGSYEKLKSS